MVPTTPININESVLEFCKEIDFTTKPTFVEFTPIEDALPSECYMNVNNYIQKNGGTAQYGWMIWEIPNVWLEAEFHAVWVNNNGEFIDITPRNDGEEKILFLPEIKREFTGEPVKNITKQLVDNELTKSMVRQAEINFESKMKYYKEINGIKDIKVGVNDLCPCGSGEKYKRCCIVL